MIHESPCNRAFVVLLSIFVGSIVIASVLARKVIDVFGRCIPAGHPGIAEKRRCKTDDGLPTRMKPVDAVKMPMPSRCPLCRR